MTCEKDISVNGVRYRFPARPVVVICNDGGDPAYLEYALDNGIVPNIARFMKRVCRDGASRHSELHLS